MLLKDPTSRNDSLISLKYEFPGGKVKKNENEITALKRELQEELSLNIGNFKKYYFTSHDYIKYSVKY